MKQSLLPSVLAAALSMPSPAMAASLHDHGYAGRDRIDRPGAFAGLRIRISGDKMLGKPIIRGGLAVATVRTQDSARGTVERRFGEGFEIGIQARDGKLALFSTADQFQEAQRRSGFSSRTALFVIGGVVVVALAGLAVTGLLINANEEKGD